MKPKNWFFLLAFFFLGSHFLVSEDKMLMFMGFLICGGFYSVLHALEKKADKKIRERKKPTCITVWGVIHIIGLCGILMFQGSFDDWNGNQVEEYQNFNAICLNINVWINIWALVVGIGVLSNKEWARRQMVELQVIQIVKIIIITLIEYIYFVPKFNIVIEGWESLVYAGDVLLCIWCRSNMTRQDVVDYFSGQKSGYDEGEDDDDYEHDDDYEDE